MAKQPVKTAAKQPPRAKKAVAKERRDPTPKEVAAIARARASHAARPARAALNVDPKVKQALALASPHSDDDGGAYLVTEAFATSSNDFTSTALLHLANLTAPLGTHPETRTLNSSLALVGAIDPQNELEAALAIQMVATHDLSLQMLLRARAAGHVDAMKEYGNLATKLSRTFATQMKTLSDWRRGGEQVVRHVHVYEGGQAVVAETINVGGQNEKPSSHCHALGPAMLGHDAGRHGMPITGSAREAAMSDARRQESGSTEGEQAQP